jgi:type IV secretory pathway VirB10-like protein
MVYDSISPFRPNHEACGKQVTCWFKVLAVTGHASENFLSIHLHQPKTTNPPTNQSIDMPSPAEIRKQIEMRRAERERQRREEEEREMRELEEAEEEERRLAEERAEAARREAEDAERRAAKAARKAERQRVRELRKKREERGMGASEDAEWTEDVEMGNAEEDACWNCRSRGLACERNG